MKWLTLLLVLCVTATNSACAEEARPADIIRASIQKSVPFIEREGWKWIRTKKCLSCHMITFMQWSLHEAELRGIDVGTDRLAELDEYVQQQAPQVDPEKKPKSGDTAAQVVISNLSYESDGRDDLDPWLTNLIRSHKEDGLWGAGGQLPSQKRPRGETQEVTNYWNLAALKSTKDVREGFSRIEAKTRERLGAGLASKDSTPKSTEWFTARLHLATRSDDKDAIEAARNSLLKLQKEDGGWGWLTESESDALATGPAIWVLLQSGMPADSDPVQRAARFLIETQRKDGTWRVESTRARDKGAVKHTSVYWGTTWAVIGLSQLLPVAE